MIGTRRPLWWPVRIPFIPELETLPEAAERTVRVVIFTTMEPRFDRITPARMQRTRPLEGAFITEELPTFIWALFRIQGMTRAVTMPMVIFISTLRRTVLRIPALRIDWRPVTWTMIPTILVREFRGPTPEAQRQVMVDETPVELTPRAQQAVAVIEAFRPTRPQLLLAMRFTPLPVGAFQWPRGVTSFVGPWMAQQLFRPAVRMDVPLTPVQVVELAFGFATEVRRTVEWFIRRFAREGFQTVLAWTIAVELRLRTRFFDLTTEWERQLETIFSTGRGPLRTYPLIGRCGSWKEPGTHESLAPRGSSWENLTHRSSSGIPNSSYDYQPIY